MSLFKAAAIAGITVVVVAGIGHSLFSGGDTRADFPGLRNFTSVAATGGDNIIVTQRDAFSVSAEGDSNAIDRLAFDVVNGELRIHRREHRSAFDWFGWWGSKGGDRDVTIRIAMPSIRAISLTGSGDVHVEGVTGNALDLSLKGSGDMDIGPLKVASLNTQLAGSGDISLSGEAGNARLSVMGSGDIGAANLKAASADIVLRGSGDISVASDGKAAVSMMGSGDVSVIGGAVCTLSGRGSGDLSCG